jgi:putrescine transport system substrate-binding protein
MVTMKRILGATVCGLTLLASAVHAEQRELRVYNWADYILPSVPKDFAAKTGIKVTWDTFDTNESLEAKLLTGNSGYDLVVPSNQFIDTQIKAGVFRNWTSRNCRTGATRIRRCSNCWTPTTLATSTACPTCTAPC